MTVGRKSVERSVEFYRIPYANSNQVAIVLEADDITGSDALAGKIIGVQLGTTGDALATEIKRCYSRAL